MTEDKKLFQRALALSAEDQLALLYRLWGYLESNTPKFTEGLEKFILDLEKEGESREQNS